MDFFGKYSALFVFLLLLIHASNKKTLFISYDS